MCTRSSADRVAHRSAFTLTELLIVIGIIVLFVTLALPAFNLISGGKSIAGAENIVGAMLGRARSEATGVQDYRGVLFYRDPISDRYAAAVLTYASYSGFSMTTTYPRYAYVSFVIGTGASAVTHYFVSTIDGNVGQTPTAGETSPSAWAECAPGALDLATDSDVVTLPAGVGVQVLNNGAMTGNARASSGYLPVGVVMFGSSGQMALKSVSLAEYGRIGTIGGFSAYNQMSIPNYVAPTTSTGAQGGLTLSTSFGLVLFDKQQYDSQGFFASSLLPSQLTTTGTANTYSTADTSSDTWLDNNATPLLINRYNGTLVKGE